MRQYRDVNGLPPKNRIQTNGVVNKINKPSPTPDLSEYESMTKEELIREIVRAKIKEARLKKGYEVEGVGAEKRFTALGSRKESPVKYTLISSWPDSALMDRCSA